MLYDSGHGEKYYTYNKISQLLIIITVIAVLIEIAIILIRRNQLVLGSSNYLKLDKNYINIVLCSFFIVIAIIDILAYSKNGSFNSSSFRLIGMFLVIDAIVCGIPLLINNLRKR